MSTASHNSYINHHTASILTSSCGSGLMGSSHRFQLSLVGFASRCRALLWRRSSWHGNKIPSSQSCLNWFHIQSYQIHHLFTHDSPILHPFFTNLRYRFKPVSGPKNLSKVFATVPATPAARLATCRIRKIPIAEKWWQTSHLCCCSSGCLNLECQLLSDALWPLWHGGGWWSRVTGGLLCTQLQVLERVLRFQTCVSTNLWKMLTLSWRYVDMMLKSARMILESPKVSSVTSLFQVWVSIELQDSSLLRACEWYLESHQLA